MKKLILTLFTVIAFINVQAQCNSNPISDNGASGTVNFSDSSTVSRAFQLITQYLIYGILEMVLHQLNKVHVIPMEIYRALLQDMLLCL
jgi:hypothetical protein